MPPASLLAEGQAEMEAAAVEPTLRAARDAPVGGQAVLEGVMMRGVSSWAVAVRKQGHDGALGEIELECFTIDSALQRHRWLRLPILRGVVALCGSLAIGFKALGIAANAQLSEEDAAGQLAGDGADRFLAKRARDERTAAAGKRAASEGRVGDGHAEPAAISGGMWVATIVIALAFAVGLFFLLPLGLTSLLRHQIGSSEWLWVFEGLVRTAIFLGYLLLISRLKDLRRVFEYHGAEHKTISCFEAGLPLTPENAKRFSRLHPRCGTSFLLVVMVVSIFVFGAVGSHDIGWLVLTRVLGVPLIAGISFEIIKLAGKHRRHKWVRAIMWPGLQLQLLTTREPDLDQLAVAIASLEAVLSREDFDALSAGDLVGVEVVA